MNNCVNIREGSNKGVDWVFSWFQAIKDISVAFAINEIIQGYVGKIEGFKNIFMWQECQSSVVLQKIWLWIQILIFCLSSLLMVGICKERTKYYSIWFFSRTVCMQERHCREHFMLCQWYILPTYQTLLVKTTSKYWQSFQVYYLTLKQRYLIVMIIFSIRKCCAYLLLQNN